MKYSKTTVKFVVYLLDFLSIYLKNQFQLQNETKKEIHVQVIPFYFFSFLMILTLSQEVFNVMCPSNLFICYIYIYICKVLFYMCTKIFVLFYLTVLCDMYYNICVLMEDNIY